MTTKWQSFAASIAEAWARPRVGGFPPSASLAAMAKLGFWQATNLCDFTGSLDDWFREVVARLPKTCKYDVGSLAETAPIARAAAKDNHPPPAPSLNLPQEPPPAPGPPSAPAANPYSDEL